LVAVQWACLHGLDPGAAQIRLLGGARHEQWSAHDNAVVELWELEALGHNWPPGAVEHIARFWELALD
jgi:poly(3-hydroxybutyrate) depolymerase